MADDTSPAATYVAGGYAKACEQDDAITGLAERVTTLAGGVDTEVESLRADTAGLRADVRVIADTAFRGLTVVAVLGAVALLVAVAALVVAIVAVTRG